MMLFMDGAAHTTDHGCYTDRPVVVMTDVHTRLVRAAAEKAACAEIRTAKREYDWTMRSASECYDEWSTETVGASEFDDSGARALFTEAFDAELELAGWR